MAQGAIAFFLDAIVKSRVSRFKYGTEVCVEYQPYNTQHALRSSQAFFMADGIKRLPNGFSIILDEVCSQTRRPRQVPNKRKGIRVSETQEFRKGFTQCSVSRQALNQIDVTINAYKGSSQKPRWIDCEPGHQVFY